MEEKLRQRLLITGFCLVLSIILIPLIFAQSQLFYEDWEDQDFTGWSNTNWAIVEDRKIDLYAAKCIAKATCDMYTTASIDTSSSNFINVSYWLNDDDLEEVDCNLYFYNTSSSWVLIDGCDAGSNGFPDNTW